MLTFNFKKYDLNEDGSMLDVGCGEGRHIFGVMQEFPKMKCIGLDMDNDSLKKAEEGYAYFESISDALRCDAVPFVAISLNPNFLSLLARPTNSTLSLLEIDRKTVPLVGIFLFPPFIALRYAVPKFGP